MKVIFSELLLGHSFVATIVPSAATTEEKLGPLKQKPGRRETDTSRRRGKYSQADNCAGEDEETQEGE